MSNSARVTALGLTIDKSEPYIKRPGWAHRFYPREAWRHPDGIVSTDGTTGEEQIWREPLTGTMMLAPRYDDTQDLTIAGTTQTGGTWQEATGLWGQTCTYLHQTDATATNTSVETGSSYEQNQCLWVDLWLYEHSASDWKATIEWGDGWSLEVQRTGEAQLYCVYQSVKELRARGRMTTGADTVFGKHLRVGLFALKRSIVMVSSSLLPVEAGEGMAIVHRSPTAVAPVSGDPTDPSTIWPSDTCKVTVSDGAYVVGIRYVTYHTSGSWMSPTTRMYPLMAANAGQGFTGTPTLEDDWVTPSGCAVVHSLRDEDGAVFGAGADITVFRDRIAFSGNGTRTPHVFWSEVRTPIETDDQVTTDTDASAWVQSITEQLSLDDHGHNVSVRFKPHVAELDSQHRFALNLYCVLTVNGQPRATFYAPRPRWREFERAGQLEWPDCENRLRKLKHVMISDARVYDGLEHTQVVQELLETAGVTSSAYAITVDPLGRTLPVAVEDEAPLYRFSNGTTVLEAIDHICKTFSGWHLYVDRSGTFIYDPCDDTTPKATFIEGGSGANSSFFQALNRREMEWLTEVDESQCYNEIWVVGEDADENQLIGFWQQDTWTLSANYPTDEPDQSLGERRVLIYVDPALNTQDAVEKTLEILKSLHGVPRYRATMRSGLDLTLLPGDYVTVESLQAGDWQIQGITTEITPDGAFADYTLEYKGTWRNRTP